MSGDRSPGAMMGGDRFRAILSRVTYRDWHLDVVPIGQGDLAPVFALRVRFRDPETAEEWTGRKWYLSPHMTDSEVLQAVLLAVLQAEEHEARERFQVDGEAIYGPHLNAWDMVEILRARGDKALEVRSAPPTPAERHTPPPPNRTETR